MQAQIETIQSSGRIGSIRISLILIFILTVLTITVFSDVFTHSFVNYDDHRIIVNRVDAYQDFSLEKISDIIFNDYPREEPLILRDLSYLVNASIFGPLNPQGYLMGNLVLHIVVSYLVYVLCLHLFPSCYILAALSSLLFAVHPIHVESVAWISSRKDPLYAAFYLLALLQYTKFFKSRGKTNLVFSAALFLCSLLSKAGAISFFPLILCYRLTMQWKRRITVPESIFYILILSTTFFYVDWYTSVLKTYGVLSDGFVLDRNWLTWVFSSCEYITFYIGKLLYPVDLSTMYDFPASHLVYSSISYLVLSLSVVCLLMFSCLYLWRQGKMNLLFIALFFICTLLPYLGLVQVKIFVADRYLYLASAAFCIGIARCVVALCNNDGRYKRIVKTGTILMLVCWSSFLIVQTQETTKNWRNTFTFWKNANRVAPKRSDTYAGLMGQYIDYYVNNVYEPDSLAGLDEARKIGERALNLFCKAKNDCPRQIVKIVMLLAEIYWQQGKIELAAEYFKMALNLHAGYVEARFMYVNFLIEQKLFEQALSHVEIIEAKAHPHMDRKLIDDLENRVKPILYRSISGESME